MRLSDKVMGDIGRRGARAVRAAEYSRFRQTLQALVVEFRGAEQ